MRIAIIDTEDIQRRTISWDNPEDFNKFIQDIEAIQRAAVNWPSVPLELDVAYLDVAITKQMGPRTIDQQDFARVEGSGIPSQASV